MIDTAPIVTERSAFLYLRHKPLRRISVTRSHKTVDEDGCGYYVYHWDVLDMDWQHEDALVLLEGGSDLYGPATGHDPGPAAMLATLVSHLRAAAEGYQAWMHDGLDPTNVPESLEGWDLAVAEFAYVYADDLPFED